MRTSLSKRVVVLLVVVATLGAGAFAVGTAAAAADATSAEATLKAIEANAEDAKVTADTRARAKAALERALRFREMGDEARARLAEGLALRLADLAKDEARAARIERGTADALKNAQDAGAQVDRERALVEEALAQSGRLKAALEALESERKKEPERTNSRVMADGGAPKAPAPTKAAPTKAADGGLK